MKNLAIILGFTVSLSMGNFGVGWGGDLIDDFTDNPESRWQFYTDQVMGGASEGSASIRKDSEGPYVRLEGLVSTANNGGFVQIRRNVNGGSKKIKSSLVIFKSFNFSNVMHLILLDLSSLAAFLNLSS